MRTYMVLFGIVVVVVVALMLANAPTLLQNTTFALPLLGSFVGPFRLIGLLGLVAVAGLYSLVWSLSATRTQARSARDLRQIEDLRRSLDKEEATRFAALSARLDEHTKNILSRLESGGAARVSGGAGGTGDSTDKLVSSVNARMDRVRDELAADIGAAEESILRALGEKRMIPEDRSRRDS